MNRTYEELLQMENCKNVYCHDCNCKMSCKGEKWTISELAADLLEARELIKETQEDLLKISQYPIAFVCEEARIIAREAWKKSKEYAE